jgi:murein DD-endopeptidase MepM/ murein hydrolase activator NlpD
LAGALIVVMIGVSGVGFVAWRRFHPSHSIKVVTIRTVVAAVVPGAQRRSLTLTGAQELLGALTSAGVPDIDAQAATQAAEVQLGGGSGELRVTLMLLPAGLGPTATGVVLSRVEARRDNGTGVIVSRLPDGRYMAAAAGADLVTQVKVVRGQMDVNSFYSSAVAAGVNDDLIPDFAQAFAYDFDFQREIKPGDVFEAVFEQQADPSGAAVGAGKLLFASLETQAKSKALYWYAPPGKPGGWFDANGHSVIRSLMRTPVEGARISSPFGLRMHPVLGFMKMHNGTDFAAPVGTPIYAAGDGVVEFSGMKGPNGNFTKILHPNGWETLYLHQSFIEPNVVAGAHVSQSQEIGLVGATGVDSAGHSTVTGPHLHYEVHINNVPVDPMSIAVGEGQALGGADMSGFIQERNRIDALRASQGG